MTPPTESPLLLPVFEDLPGVKAFFTTRRGGVSEGGYASLNLGPRSGDSAESVRRNWARVLEAAGWSGHALALPALCHGAAHAEIDAEPIQKSRIGFADLEPADVDAVSTRRRGWVLAVTMADCLPALIADPESGCVAAVHAGWRGTRDRALGKTLEALFASGRCRPASTRVALGPCLSPEALELPAEVTASLPREHVLEAAGRRFFDLRGANRAQAVAAGVLPAHVFEKGGCTRENPESFFSYRRDGGVTGRMAACIALD